MNLFGLYIFQENGKTSIRGKHTAERMHASMQKIIHFKVTALIPLYLSYITFTI